MSIPLLLLILLGYAFAELLIDVPHFVEVYEDVAKTIQPAVQILSHGIDDDETATLLATLMIDCSAGHVSLPPSPKSLAVSPSYALKANGTIAALNEALTQATYTSARDNRKVKRTSSFEVCSVVVDFSIPGVGVKAANAKFLVDVLAVNDPPLINVPGVIHRMLQDRGGYVVESVGTLTVEEDELLSIDMFISDVDFDQIGRAHV